MHIYMIILVRSVAFDGVLWTLLLNTCYYYVIVAAFGNVSIYFYIVLQYPPASCFSLYFCCTVPHCFLLFIIFLLYSTPLLLAFHYISVVQYPPASCFSLYFCCTVPPCFLLFIIFLLYSTPLLLAFYYISVVHRRKYTVCNVYILYILYIIKYTVCNVYILYMIVCTPHKVHSMQHSWFVRTLTH